MKPNPRMVTLARESRGLSQGDLAHAMGMTAPHLSRIEKGDVMLTGEYIDRLAEATRFPKQFFYRTGDILPEHLAYRRRIHVSFKQLYAIQAWVNIIRLHVEQLAPLVLHRYQLRLPQYKVTERNTPAKIAERVRRDWELDKPVIPNMVRLLEDKGIVTIAVDFGTERVDSLHIITKDKIPVIIYNKLLLGDRQRFTLAYELGQLIMHSIDHLQPDTDISREANEFAAAFLMPSEAIRGDLRGDVTVALLAALKKKWKQSMISILYRADDLGLINANQKRSLLQQFNHLHIRRHEPLELDVPAEESKLMKHWIAEYRSKTGLGTAGVAEAFALRTDEFLELYA